MADDLVSGALKKGVTGRKVELIFQTCPGTGCPIQGLAYTILIDGKERAMGVTGADGKVTLTLKAGQIGVVKAMGTEYELKLLGSVEAIGTVRGVQRRLNMLGYGAGGVDGVVGKKTEYAVLNFQADNAPLVIDGLAGPKTKDKLKSVAGT